MKRNCKIKLYRWKRRYKIKCAWRISGMTFIRYAQGQKLRKPNKLKLFVPIKPKGLSRIAKIDKHERTAWIFIKLESDARVIYRCFIHGNYLIMFINIHWVFFYQWAYSCLPYNWPKFSKAFIILNISYYD